MANLSSDESLLMFWYWIWSNHKVLLFVLIFYALGCAAILLYLNISLRDQVIHLVNAPKRDVRDLLRTFRSWIVQGVSGVWGPLAISVLILGLLPFVTRTGQIEEAIVQMLTWSPAFLIALYQLKVCYNGCCELRRHVRGEY